MSIFNVSSILGAIRWVERGLLTRLQRVQRPRSTTTSRLRIAISLLSLAALAGCDSMAERVHERFTAVPPKTQVFTGDERTIRSAVLITFKRLEFVVNRPTGDPDGIEAFSRIRHGELLGDNRQLAAVVHLWGAGPGQTEVQILLSEEVENAAAGAPTEQPLREHGLYGTFFETLQQVLAGSTGPAAGSGG